MTAGYLVRATPGEAAAVAALTDVTSVALAPILAPARSEAVPQIGAPAVWSDLGFRGDDILVAVLDTGIDYTHKDFGGPGTVEAYQANDENIVESGTFPTRKVVGGYDLAGRRYSPHPSCIEPNPPSQACTKTPRPDDDPLDSRGHGTHVSGVVAGLGLPGLEGGVAPAARLVALKIFGNPIDAPVVSDLMPAAFDWVFRNNIDADLPGWPTDRIQVIDMSLTSAWLGGAYETRQLIRAANERGITVVVAAGNDGAMPFLMGPLAGAETALTVGAAWPTGQHGLQYRATWTDATPHEVAGLAYDTRIAGQVTTRDKPLQGSLAWMGTGCDDEPPVQPVAGMVALVARGDCGFTEKIGNAQALAAKAVVVFTTAGLPASEMGGAATLNIPAVMIDNEAGLALRGALEASLAVTIQVSEPADLDVLGGTAARFSSRGPSRFQPGLKPQVVAPGLRVTSTRVGTGDGVEEASGTSVAASMAAGAAALLWQRVVDDKLPLSAADIAAALENHAAPDVRIDHSTLGAVAPVTARGAGFLDARAAVGASTVVRSDTGLAEVDFGLLHVTGAEVERQAKLSVRNLGPEDRTYRVTSRFLYPEEDEGHGVYVSVEPEHLEVASGATGEATVRLRVVPGELRPWNLYAVEAVVNPDLVGQMEVDGLVEIVETDSSGADRPGGDAITVPWLALAVRHSCIRGLTPGPFVVSTPGDKVRQSFDNPCPTPGWVNAYSLLAEDAQEPAVPPALDITAIAFRRYLAEPEDPSSDVIMEWAIRTEGPRRTPAAAQFRIYIDV
ncbi:MAG: S8 family serine peptidase, partial [Anaerolineae bacterium]